MKALVLVPVLMFVASVSYADILFDTVHLIDGDRVGVGDIERIHRFDDGEIDFLTLRDGDIVEGTDIDGFSRLGGAGGGGLGEEAPHANGGAGGKGLPEPGSVPLHAGRGGAGGGGGSRL